MKRNYLKLISHYIINIVFVYLLKCYSVFVKKERNTLFCIQDPAMINDNVNLLNYASDNVLSCVNYMMNSSKSKEFYFYIVCFDINDYDKCINHTSGLRNVKILISPTFYKISWTKIKTSIIYYKFFFKSHIVLYSDILMQFPYKRSKQLLVCLNYFIPFKLDNPIIRYKEKTDYVISTSYLASQITSLSSAISFERFVVLGFSRNDNIISPRYTKDKILSLLKLYPKSHLIVYTPTHRREQETTANEVRDILGYDGEYYSLDQILIANNAFLLIKMHPGQSLKYVKKYIGYERIKIYQPNENYSLYDLLPHVDLLITDYTSTYFDYLLTNRPVVFNFYDKEQYRKQRGFSYDPIENICAGKIVETKKQLEEAISCFLKNDIPNNSEHYEFVKKMEHKYIDALSSSRIEDFLISYIEK